MGTMGELSNQWAIFYRYAVTWDEIVKQQAVFGSKKRLCCCSLSPVFVGQQTLKKSVHCMFCQFYPIFVE
jgi:hypothetical protein